MGGAMTGADRGKQGFGAFNVPADGKTGAGRVAGADCCGKFTVPFLEGFIGATR